MKRLRAGPRLRQGAPMPTLIAAPTRIVAAGNKPKSLEEYVGRVNSKTSPVSVAHMKSPAGWVEPGQRPAFDECTLVRRGMLRVEHEGGVLVRGEGTTVGLRRDQNVRGG